MTCDYQDKDGFEQHCGNDEFLSEDVYCETGKHHLIIYKCKEHRDEKILFDRMMEIIQDNPELYGENAYENLNCDCLLTLVSKGGSKND